MTYEEQPITVYRVVGHTVRTCEYGEHGASVVSVKRLGPVIGHREYDNGYEKRMTDVRQDAQGRTYHQHVEIDFFNNVSWWCDEDRQSFTTRIPYGEVVFDVTGRRLQ